MMILIITIEYSNMVIDLLLGMSELMDNALKEARAGNESLKKQVQHIGNVFLNSTEICAQVLDLYS